MSHFYMIALVPRNELVPPDPTDELRWLKAGELYVTSFIETQMERYRENRKVPEYDKKCECVGCTAQCVAQEKADGVLTINAARDIMAQRRERELPEVHAQIEQDGHGFNLSADHEYAHDMLWQDVLKPRLEAEKVFCEAHPLHEKPDPDCEECKGSGTYRSTYNPESKWDWYRIGGRWAGTIQKTEYKSQDQGFNFDDACEALYLNIMTVEALLAQWEPTDAPLAILTPDGEWHERGAMGIFGMFRCDPHEPTQWRDAAKQIMEMNRGCIAVGIDCHI